MASIADSTSDSAESITFGRCISFAKLGLFQKLSSLFCPVEGGCFVDNLSEGWGVGGGGVTCPGGQGIFDP